MTTVKILKRLLPIALLAVARTAFAPAAGAQDDFKYPLTIMPYQARAYVQDREAAEMLSTVAEFPVPLLRWNDTPKQPVLQLERGIKSSINPFYTEWSAGSPPKLGVRDIQTKVRQWYESLQSKRLVRLTVGSSFEVTPPGLPLDVIGDAPVDVPFLVANQGDAKVTVVLRQAGKTGPLDTIEIGGGRMTGRWVKIAPGPSSAKSVKLSVEAGGTRRDLELAARAWPRATARVRVLDERGVPTPARIYLTGPDGRAYAPAGVVHRVVSGDYRQPYAGEYYFYTGGTFDAVVPAGEVEIEAVKGLEYAPVRKRVRVAPGRMRPSTSL